MKIGVLITSISNFGKKGFYNSQEVGLAKALANICEAVEVYKLVPISEDKREEKIDGTNNAKIIFIPSYNKGINGVLDTTVLDNCLDAIVHFSDTQFAVPKVYAWCQNHAIQYIPYIGVIESHSTSKLKRLITNLSFKKNLAIYKKCSCCVKTPTVKQQLQKLGVVSTTVVPVGLDIDLMKKEYDKTSVAALLNKYGYSKEKKVLLFIGRMIDEKQPIRMLSIFHKIAAVSDDYCLLMVGSGELLPAVKKRIEELHLDEKVNVMESIPNSDIWELYCMADAFVNLNQQEIFGMAILEAMYYDCKVVAWKAPGPDYIITNGRTGYVVSSEDEVIDCIIKRAELDDLPHKRIIENFTWDYSAREILKTVGGYNG